MEKLNLSAKINTILGVIAGLALILLYLALSDIADDPSNSSLEWYIAGVCMIILGIFIISSLITARFVYKYTKPGQ